jgi:hypothetical protein
MHQRLCRLPSLPLPSKSSNRAPFCRAAHGKSALSRSEQSLEVRVAICNPSHALASCHGPRLNRRDPEMKSVKGRVTVITGAGSGFGRELAILCAKEDMPSRACRRRHLGDGRDTVLIGSGKYVHRSTLRRFSIERRRRVGRCYLSDVWGMRCSLQ